MNSMCMPYSALKWTAMLWTEDKSIELYWTAVNWEISQLTEPLLGRVHFSMDKK